MNRIRLRTLALALVFGCAGEHASTLAVEQGLPWGIALDASFVYWVNVGGTVKKVAKEGGTPIVIASGQVSPTSIAIDANDVYWTNSGTSSCSSVTGACTSNADGTIMSVPLAGGTPTVVAGGQRTPVSIAVDAVNAYFVDEGTGVYNSPDTDGSVMKVPIGGGTPTALATGLSYPGALAIDATSVYWTVLNPDLTGTLMKVAIAGGAVTTLATGWWGWEIQTGDGTIPQLIAADGTSVYWVTGNINGAKAQIMKVATSGGPTTSLSSIQSEFTTLALDATHLYWTDGGNFLSLLTAGGVPTTFATGEAPQEPGGLALDATNVYWTDGISQKVMSARR